MMHRLTNVLFALMLFGLSTTLDGQTWQTLTNVPTTSRYNDAYFVTPTLGWIVNGVGQIFKTVDGGRSWQLQFQQSATHFRSVGFLDSLRGWAGNVGPGEFGATDSAVFYQTLDGGQNWQPLYTFNGPKPAGLCGMHVVNDSVVCAVGRVRGPAFFAKTIDAGNTWRSVDMSPYAAGLIDVYFFHPDTGFAVGLTNRTHDNSSGVVLSTTDGGATWETRFITKRTGEWCWKISFPSRRTGYASLQRNSLTPIYFLKTSDGGNTWEEKLFSNAYYFVQGIGFLTEKLGWIGGSSSSSSGVETTDGGDTWHPAGFGSRLNRFRFVNDTLGYAVGREVYKYSNMPTRVAADNNELPFAFALAQNYPNPFWRGAKSIARDEATPYTTISYQLPKRATVNIKIYDFLGREVRELIDQTQEAGQQTVAWDGTDTWNHPVPAGIYFYVMRAGDFTQTRKMILLP
jgi:photosystem II stability/assembly factor-like uncharacterized protein